MITANYCDVVVVFILMTTFGKAFNDLKKFVITINNHRTQIFEEMNSINNLAKTFNKHDRHAVSIGLREHNDQNILMIGTHLTRGYL